MADSLTPKSTIFLLCDVQTKFRPAIHGYNEVIATVNKMMKIAKLLDCRVLATTQNAKALGPIDPAIDLDSLGELHLATVDKTKFSMLTLEVKDILERPELVQRTESLVLMGIEAHICVLQTALHLLKWRHRYKVFVVYDGIASSHPTEKDIAVERLRTAGAIITTSESVAFELIEDASHARFREFSKIIKESKMATAEGSLL